MDTANKNTAEAAFQDIIERKKRERARRFRVTFTPKEGTRELLPSWPFTKSRPFVGDEVITLEDAQTGAKYIYHAIMAPEGHIELISKNPKGFFLKYPGHRKFTREGSPLN